MFNIKYKGSYVSDEQMIKTKKIPKEAIQFGIVKSLNREFAIGFLMLLPLMMILFITTYIKVKDIAYHLTMNIEIIISFFIVLGLIYVLTFVHEFIHACFYPLKAEKEIYKSKSLGAYFVYSEEMITKRRYIVMVLAPMFLLGIIPYIIWLLLPQMIPMPFYLIIPITCWFMTIMSMGDVANVYHVLKEVPNKAKLFNHGLLDSYYIK